MKIYWTKKSIPELRNLPPEIRKRNYREASKCARTHIEYWVGAGLFGLMIVILTMLFGKVFPGPDTMMRDILRSVFTIPPSVIILSQFEIYAARKHYRHILMRET